jgi:hypothetical protein
MGEVKHLGLPPYCKTFAQTEACSNRQGWKKPFKKIQPSVFFGFFWFLFEFFLYICPEERIFRVFQFQE